MKQHSQRPRPGRPVADAATRIIPGKLAEALPDEPPRKIVKSGTRSGSVVEPALTR